MDASLYKKRLLEYYGRHLNFSIYYDKIYKKEYLPSRIRYNQFFFYTALFGLSYYTFKGQGSNFCPQEETTTDLGQRKYYTSERSAVNFVMRQMNKASASSHEKQQEFVF